MENKDRMSGFITLKYKESRVVVSSMFYQKEIKKNCSSNKINLNF